MTETTPEVKQPEVKQVDIADLMRQMNEATAKADLAEVIRLGNILKKEKSAVEKAENEKLAREAEELSGTRTELGSKIHKGIMTGQDIRPLIMQLKDVKAQGFTYKPDGPGPDGGMVKYKSVELMVEKPKAVKRSGGGGGGTQSSTKDETGLNLSELIDKYATDAEKAEITEAYEKGEAEKKGSGGSKKWQKQVKVKTRILKDNPNLTAKS